MAHDVAALAAPARLLRYDEAYYARWLDRAESALARASNRDAPRLLRAYSTVKSLLIRLQPTFIHGEFHASNVLVEALPSGVKITPVDWEMAALGPGLMDLADLTAGKWTPAQRDAMAGAYREAASAAGAATGSDFPRDLACCRLHRAIQWLSWSPGWTPPREHAHDWLGEALLACESLAAAGVTTA
jgi:aminoglycoside phosphotransferase (APT) family kinase protein